MTNELIASHLIHRIIHKGGRAIPTVIDFEPWPILRDAPIGAPQDEVFDLGQEP